MKDKYVNVKIDDPVAAERLLWLAKQGKLSSVGILDATEVSRQQISDAKPVVRRIAPHPGPTSLSRSPAELAASASLTKQEMEIIADQLPEITRRERDALFEIIAGGTNEAIARRMDITIPTLRTHLMRLNQKLGSTSKSDLVRLVMQAVILEYRERLFGPADDKPVKTHIITTGLTQRPSPTN